MLKKKKRKIKDRRKEGNIDRDVAIYIDEAKMYHYEIEDQGLCLSTKLLLHTKHGMPKLIFQERER